MLPRLAQGEFHAVLEMTIYNAIKDGTAHPGLMLVHGMNDPRVDVWQSGKVAARLRAANESDEPTLPHLGKQAGHGMGGTLTQRQAQASAAQAFLRW